MRILEHHMVCCTHFRWLRNHGGVDCLFFFLAQTIRKLDLMPHVSVWLD
jgi:hypothetical protein